MFDESEEPKGDQKRLARLQELIDELQMLVIPEQKTEEPAVEIEVAPEEDKLEL